MCTVRDGSPITTSIRQLKIKVLSTHLDLQFTKYFQYVLKMSIMYSNMHFKNPTYCTFSFIQMRIYEITIIIFINSTWLFIYQLQKVLHWYCSFYSTEHGVWNAFKMHPQHLKKITVWWRYMAKYLRRQCVNNLYPGIIKVTYCDANFYLMTSHSRFIQ